jgi:phosphoglycolate phosphatase
LISALILDLDGPLLDGMQRHYRCYRDVLNEYGYRAIPVEQYWEMKRNRVDRRALLELSGASSLYNEYLNAWMDRIEAREYLELDRLQNDVVDVLLRWKRQGLRLFLDTMRNRPDNLSWQLDKLELRQFFEDVVVVGSGEDGVSKASEIKPRLTGIDVNGLVWVGDTEADVVAARELGVRMCALTCGLRTREYLMSLLPDYIEADLHSFEETVRKNID